MRTPPRSESGINWERVGFGYAVWTLLALLAITETAWSMRARGVPVPWASLVPDRFLEWYGDGLLSLVLAWTVRRYPTGITRWRTVLPVYLAAMMLCIALKVAIVVPVMRGLEPPSTMSATTVRVEQAVVGFIVFTIVLTVLNVMELQRRLKQREQLATELRAQLSEAELELLKGQLQPHFLFNTLNGVASLIHTAPHTADLVVVQLADLLRASLDYRGGAEISLAAELVLVDKYLAIMEARFQGKLSIHRDIDAATLGAFVPQFILQPLVENAFEHGIARSGANGQIIIRALRDRGGRLRLQVSDNGAGLSATSVEEGVGLSNTRRRLERLYGGDHVLTLSAPHDGGTLVTVEIPFRTV